MSNLGIILASLPACGYGCLIGAVSRLSNCSLADTKCTCADAGVQAAAYTCVWTSCSESDALRFEKSTFARCGVRPVADYSYEPVVFSLMSLATVFLALRFAARLYKGFTLWWDDWFVASSMLPVFAFAYVIYECRRLGAGLPIWAVQQENIGPILRYFLITFLLYFASRCAVRVSMSLSMLRIFTRHRPVIIATTVLNLVFSMVMVFCIVFNCTPVSYFWSLRDLHNDGHCMNLWATILAGTITATVLDIMHASLPVYWVFQLEIPPAKKLATGAMFLMNVPVHVFSLLKFWSVHAFLRSNDTTGKLPGVLMYAGLEMTLSVILCGIPSLRLLLAPWVATLRGRDQPAETHSHDSQASPCKMAPVDDGPDGGGVFTNFTLQQHLDSMSECDVIMALEKTESGPRVYG